MGEGGPARSAVRDGDGLHVLVVGAGMYVTGRDSEGRGTILPSLFQCARGGLVDRVSVASTRPESAQGALAAARELSGLQEVDLPVRAEPSQGVDEKAFLRLAEEDPPDCAVVSVPDHLHHAVAGPLLDRGIHVQVVKPLTPGVEEALDLVERAREAGVLGRVEFHKRYDESNLVLRELVRSGELGEPVEFAVRYSQRKVIPEKVFRKWVERTDVFQYLGVHYVDLIHYFTGALPARLSSLGSRGWLSGRGVDAYDAIHTTIRWEDGDGSRFVSTHFTSWIDPDRSTAMSDQRIHFVGTEGRAEFDQKDRGIRVTAGEEGLEHVNPYFSAHLQGPGDRVPRFGGYGFRSVRHFLEDVAAVREGRKTVASLEGEGRATFRSALPSVAAVEASRASLAREGEWVAVPDVVEGMGAR